MMFRIHVRKVLAILLVLEIFVPSLKALSDESNKVIILYDSYKEYGETEEKLSSLIKISLATNNEVKVKKMSAYEKGEIDYYKGAIILSNNENSIDNQVIEDVLYYKNKCICIGRNVENIRKKLQEQYGKNLNNVENDEYSGLVIKELNNISLIQDFSEVDSSYFALRRYVLKSLGVNKRVGKNYLMIDRVYAVNNLSELMDKIDYLYSQGIRFILSIMPVYENVNLKSMRNYTEILRYAQIKGGKMFLHSADVYREGIMGKDIYERMNNGYGNYINYQVYPLALDIPEDWLYLKDYKIIFNKSNTLALEKGKDIDATYLENYTLKSFENFLEKVDLTSIKVINKNLIDQNIIFTIPNNLNFEEFKRAANLIKDKDIYISDPKYLNMKMEFNESQIVTNNINGIYINETPMDLKGSVSQSAIKEDVTVTQDKNDEHFSLKQINTVIIVVTVGACVIFLVIALISRRIDRRKYFK